MSLITAFNAKKGVSTIEYALIIAVVVVGLMAMAAYLRRGLSRKWREAGDMFGHGRQYERAQGNIIQRNIIQSQ